jgi:tyrosine-specific transport protein
MDNQTTLQRSISHKIMMGRSGTVTLAVLCWALTCLPCPSCGFSPSLIATRSGLVRSRPQQHTDTTFVGTQAQTQCPQSATVLASSREFDFSDDVPDFRLQLEQRGDATKATATSEQTLTFDPSFIEAASNIAAASLLITAGTAGASMLALPDAVSRAGVPMSLCVFAATYCINLLSSFYVMDVSIAQYEKSRKEGVAPEDLATSFQDIATESFGPVAGVITTVVTMIFNWSALVFAMLKCGDIVSGLAPGVDATFATVAFSGMLAAICGSLSYQALSNVASVFVAALFLSFAGLVLPGLAHSDLSALIPSLHAPASDIQAFALSDFQASLSAVAPTIVYSMAFQNIIPIVTKLCNFDRTQTTASIVLGSAMPTIMYLAYIAVSLQGGFDVFPQDSVGAASMILPFFYLASVGGSSVSGVMGMAEEFHALLRPSKSDTSDSETNASTDTNSSQVPNIPTSTKDGHLGLTPVLMSVIPPLLIGLQVSHGGGGGIDVALDVAGGYCTPLLCWVFPALLGWKTLAEKKKLDVQHFPLAGMSVCSVGFMSQRFLQDSMSFVQDFDMAQAMEAITLPAFLY